MRIKSSTNNISAIFKRELSGYFGSPVAYVFIVIFLLLIGFFTFYISRFFEIGQADLRSFFQWHPWVFMFLIPAVAMKLWSEERRLGTIELVLTLPVTVTEVILGKFLAAWFFIGISLSLTFPMVLTVLYLGSPDMGAILRIRGKFPNGRGISERGHHDIIPDAKPGYQLYTVSGHLPVFYFSWLSTYYQSPLRMGAALACKSGFEIKLSFTLCFH